MRSRMHPKYYLAQEIFEIERKKIFHKTWLFAGLKSFLQKNNSYLTKNIAGIPVVIQNFNGSLHAFENICLHRSAPLQKNFTGVRALTCPYHAWSYDNQGYVKKIPDNDSIYGFSEEEKRYLRLKEFKLVEIGELIFINLAPDPMPIEDQFSLEFIALLRSSAESYDSEVIMTTWDAKFNWKLAYENLRDFNHIKYLHSNSLARFAKFPFEAKNQQLDSISPSYFTPSAFRREIKNFSYGGPEGAIEKIEILPWLTQVERWGQTDAYFNWLAYPNLHIASGNGGYSFSIENHIPVSPSETKVEIYFFTAKKKRKYASSPQVLLAHMHYGKEILKEDFEMLESIQSSLHMDAPIPNQGSYEYINRRIEIWYTTLMETEHEI